jgi:hypothetical protein
MVEGEHVPDSGPWTPRLRRWAQRLRAAGLDGAVGALLDAAEPLGPLGAQMLWIAQPALGLVAPRDEVASLARLLDAPGGVAWLREQLAAPDDGAETP